MQFENYISDLLYRYDCVVVPEFGAFLTHRISSKLHQSTHTFYPPKKVLSFNQNLKTNDGLLANYISEVEKIPYSSALESISHQVEILKSYLNEGERIALNNIGNLILNQEGNVVFEPSYHVNYLTDAFGLTHFNTNEIKRETYKEEVEVLEAQNPITITPETRVKEKVKKRPYYLHAAASVVILAVLGFSAINYHHKNIEHQNQITTKEANKAFEKEIQSATFFIEQPLPTVALQLKKQPLNFHIIAGAFRFEINAQSKVEALKKQGFNSKIIGQSYSGLYQVVYSSFASLEEATQTLKAIKTSIDKDAWLLEKPID